MFDRLSFQDCFGTGSVQRLIALRWSMSYAGVRVVSDTEPGHETRRLLHRPIHVHSYLRRTSKEHRHNSDARFLYAQPASV